MEVNGKKPIEYLTFMSVRLLIFAIFFLFTPSTIQSAIPKIILNDQVSSYNDFQIEYLEEKPGESLGIEVISKLPFTKNISNAFTFGYDENNFWFRFSVQNDSEEPKNMVLELTEIIHKKVDLYILSDTITHYKNGLRIPVKEREIKESNPAFPLHFAAHETKELYINIASIYAVFGALKLKTPEQFRQDTHLRSNIYFFYFGAIIAIALYNLFIFFYLREKIYLYYVSYVLVFVIWAANYKGLLLPYINMEIYDILQITIPIFFTMLILFSQTVLETKKSFPVFHTILNIFIVILFISFVWMLLSMHSGFYFMNLVSGPLLPFLLFISIWALNQDHKIAKIYLIGLSIYIVSMILISQLALATLPYSILLSNAPIIGSFFEIILFSLLLAYRINLLRQDKLDTQAILLEQEHTEAARLSKMVKAQTAVLMKTKKALEKELEERKELEKHLKYQASTDPLTNLLNRRSFFERCNSEIKYAMRYNTELSLLIIDIDKFKIVNDTYGHQAGDQAIKSIAEEITETIRTTDILARIGGEEFAVLMPMTESEPAHQLGERIRLNIAQKEMNFEDHILQITVSIGLATLQKEDPDIQSVFKRSDQALYNAKENGRNQVCYKEA